MCRHAASRPESDVLQFLPQSFVFYPAKPELSEKQAFLDAFARRAAAAAVAEGCGASRNAWILKPSDGGKGDGIQVVAGDGPFGAAPIVSFVEAQPVGSIAWVVSEYIERPLLLPGGRKFDWRCARSTIPCPAGEPSLTFRAILSSSLAQCDFLFKTS
jgi:hypothetical protein